MKNILYKTLVFIVLFGLTNTIKAQEKKVALVSFNCNKKILAGGLEARAIQTLSEDPSFDLKPTLDKAYAKFVNEFAKDFPFKLIDKEIVESNEAYKKYESRMDIDTTKEVNKILGITAVTVDGLKVAYPSGVLTRLEYKDECNLAKIFNAQDGVMFVFIDYEFESRMMGLASGVIASITVALYDKKCDKVFKIRESGKSVKKVPAVMGIPVIKPKEIQGVCADATEQLFKDLENKIAKIIKKSTKF